MLAPRVRRRRPARGDAGQVSGDGRGVNGPRERHVQNEILRAFGTKRWMRIWRANVGVARMGSRVVRFGVPGQADLTGILPDGRRLEVEAKSATGRQSIAQRNFQHLIERFGGLYVLARSVEDVRLALVNAGYDAEAP